MLSVIAVLGGASFLGGGLALGGMVTERIAEEREPEPAVVDPSDEPPEESPSPTEPPVPEFTEEPSDPPAQDPDEPLLTADEVVADLRDDYDGLQAGVDMTDELCQEEEENPLFVCTSAVHTNLVRVVAFENAVLADTLAMVLQNQPDDEENDAVDAQNACHLVLVWFEEGGMEQSERDDMTADVENIAGC